jgi:hypothetical protein
VACTRQDYIIKTLLEDSRSMCSERISPDFIITTFFRAVVIALWRARICMVPYVGVICCREAKLLCDDSETLSRESTSMCLFGGAI